jgi:hypothetical protein
LQDVVAVKVAGGHSYILLGDLNARVGSASTADQRIGQFGEPGQPNAAGLQLIGLLSSCVLNSRSPGDNITFNFGDRPCSILDYAVVPSELYHAGAAAAAAGGRGADWHTQCSGHVPVIATVPLQAVRARVPRPPPVYRWRLDAFLNNEAKEELCALYEGALASGWERVRDAAQGQGPEDLVRTITSVIETAAEAAIGMKKILPGKSRGWWTTAIKGAIAQRRECYQRTRERPGNAEALEGLQAQKRVVKLLVREAFSQKQATAVNSAFSGQADGHSPLGKKRFWRQLQAYATCTSPAGTCYMYIACSCRCTCTMAGR